ncbi:MAG: NADAR family protein [Cellulosilyticaceae bacterium]
MNAMQNHSREQYLLNRLGADDGGMLFFWSQVRASDQKVSRFCLSHWWQQEFEVDGVKYIAMEQYIMAERARLFEDYYTLVRIMESKDVNAISALGNCVRYFNQYIWEEHEEKIYIKGNYAKFSQNKVLKKYLLETEDKLLVEVSPYDTRHYKTNNKIGWSLMAVREQLKKN